MAAAEREGARWNLTVRPNTEIRLETQEALVLEDIKHIVEKTMGRKRPDDPRGLLRKRKPNTYRFNDDGLYSKSSWLSMDTSPDADPHSDDGKRHGECSDPTDPVQPSFDHELSHHLSFAH